MTPAAPQDSQANAAAMESLYPFLYSGKTDIEVVLAEVRHPPQPAPTHRRKAEAGTALMCAHPARVLAVIGIGIGPLTAFRNCPLAVRANAAQPAYRPDNLVSGYGSIHVSLSWLCLPAQRTGRPWIRCCPWMLVTRLAVTSGMYPPGG